MGELLKGIADCSRLDIGATSCDVEILAIPLSDGVTVKCNVLASVEICL